MTQLDKYSYKRMRAEYGSPTLGEKIEVIKRDGRFVANDQIGITPEAALGGRPPKMRIFFPLGYEAVITTLNTCLRLKGRHIPLRDEDILQVRRTSILGGADVLREIIGNHHTRGVAVSIWLDSEDQGGIL